jgi:hypothetical protein
VAPVDDRGSCITGKVVGAMCWAGEFTPKRRNAGVENVRKHVREGKPRGLRALHFSDDTSSAVRRQGRAFHPLGGIYFALIALLGANG